MPAVLPRLGDIFEGGVDLTVLPCSAKGTVSSATRRWIDLFGLPALSSLTTPPRLGCISDVLDFPGDKKRTKFVVYAASVFNDSTSMEAIESIARALGDTTKQNERVRIVEVPLLGTGAGRLSTVDSIRSLAKGFLASAAPEAQLYVFAFDTERHQAMISAMELKTAKLLDAVNFRPGLFGFSVDLKKLFRRKR